MRPSAKQPVFLGLDYLRFLAALSVVFYHLGLQNWVGTRAFPEYESMKQIVRWGWLGVPIFFTLSGFVIAFSAHEKSGKAFLKSRVLRLYPAAWLVSTLLLILQWGQPQILPAYIRSVSLFPVGPWVSGVYWTLGVEVMFYLAVLATLALRWSLVRLAAVLALVSTTFWLMRVADQLLGRPLGGALEPVQGQFGAILLLSTGCYFALGITFWALSRFGRNFQTIVVAAYAALGCAIGMFADGRFNLAVHGGGGSQLLIAPIIGLLAVGALAACVYWNEAITRALGQWQNGARLLGLLTYPLYLVHQELSRAVMPLAASVGAWPALVVGLTSSLFAAYAILVGEPVIRKALRAMMERRRFRHSSGAAASTE